jgi:hypothetical protein
MLATTPASERTGRTKMLRSLARPSGSEPVVQTGFSAVFITITSGVRFSVHTGCCEPIDWVLAIDPAIRMVQPR